MRKARVYISERRAGEILETNDGDFVFSYDRDYLQRPDAVPVSRTLPLREEAYQSKILFPFFDGLIPEGWLLDLSTRNWKLKNGDRMGLLLAVCEDCIGNVSVRSESEA